MSTVLKPANEDVLPSGDLPNWRYPDPRVEVLDKRLKAPDRQCDDRRIAAPAHRHQ